MKGNNDKVLSQIVGHALSGQGAHAGTQCVFDGLDWKTAAMRPPGALHSIFQLLAHTSYWQNWVLRWLNGQDPAVPKHAAGSWPSDLGPASPQEWKRAVRDFRVGLDQLAQEADAEAVEGAHPELPHGHGDQALDPVPHLLGGLVGEGHRQDRLWHHTVMLDQIGNPKRDDARLPTARSGKNQ